jgi:hypothetical protein
MRSPLPFMAPLVLALAAGGCAATITPAATTFPVTAEMDFAQLATMKRGETCALTILGVFGPNGDASVATAAQAGGITRVRYVDNRFENRFLWHRFCVVAYGE